MYAFAPTMYAFDETYNKASEASIPATDGAKRAISQFLLRTLANCAASPAAF